MTNLDSPRRRSPRSIRNVFVGILAVSAVLLGILAMHAMAAGEMPMATPPAASMADRVVTTAIVTVAGSTVQLAENLGVAVPVGTALTSFGIICTLGIAAIVLLLALARGSTPRVVLGKLRRRLRISASRLTFADPPSLHVLSISRT